MNEPTASDRSRAALGALPELEPPADAWAGIEARLAAGPRRARARAGLVVAAVALAAIGVRVLDRPAPAPGPATPPVAAATDAGLDRRAAELERLLAALPSPRAARASTGYATTLLEDRIALVDERLGLPDVAALSPEDETALKKQRVVLLDSLMRVKYASAVNATL
jgi:hypothetical protein